MISVIIPVYNNAETILNALRSVIQQTFTDYEVIVVDDASTDHTAAIVDSFIKDMEGDIRTKDRLKRIALPRNSGPACARNCGAKQAKGEWLAFLDGDDTWMPEKLAVQMMTAEKHPDIDMWCAKVEVVWREKGSAAVDRQRRPAESSFEEIFLKDFVYQNPVATSSVLIKKTVFNDTGGFDEQFRGPEDYDLWMRVASKYRIFKAEQALARYKSEVGSLSMDDRKFLPQVLKVLEKAFDGGVLKGHSDMRKSAVANQYWNASWMAYRRNARVVAIMCLLKGWVLSCCGRKKLDRRWLPLLMRYVFIKPMTRS